MKLRYIIPGPIGKTALGEKEVLRRQAILKQWVFPGVDIDVVAVDKGPASIESMYEEYLSIPPTAERVMEAQSNNFDAVIIGCFGDPGLDGLREISEMLVVGPAGASIAMATTLGHRFSIITVTSSIISPLRRLVWEAGALDKLASIRAIETSVIELNQDHALATGKMIKMGKRAVEEDGAEVLVLGCMSMGFLDVAEEMMDRLKVPVINPSKASVKMAESLVACNLSHSNLAYMTPPKIIAGTKLKDLWIE